MSRSPITNGWPLPGVCGLQVLQDYPKPELPSPGSESPPRYFRGNGRQWGGLISGNFPFHSTLHSRAPADSAPEAEPEAGKWSTANTMNTHESSAYQQGDRFTRKNKSLKIALQLKKAYAAGDVGARSTKVKTNKLPSLRRCAPGSFNPTFD
eukprot:m.12837 g.12837  ORF g.12837 m.12837 type:complete len:152 (+) comp7905_c0_seq1:83-538(+)